MPLVRNPQTGLLEIVGYGKPSELGNLHRAATPAVPAAPAQPVAQSNSILSTIGRGALGLASDVAQSVPRFLASPAALLSEDLPALLSGKQAESNAFSRWVFGDSTPGSKERAGAVMGQALSGASLLVGGGMAAKAAAEAAAAKLAGKAVAKATFGSIARQAVKTAPIDAALGAGFGFASGVEEGKSGAELAKSTGFGALTGAIAPVALGGIFHGGAKLAGLAGRTATSVVDSRIAAAEAKLVGAKAALTGLIPTLRQGEAVAKAQKSLDFYNTIREKPTVFKQNWINVMERVRQRGKTIMGITGEATDYGARVQGSEAAGRGQSVLIAKAFVQTAKEAGDAWEPAMQLAMLKNEEDRLKLGLAVAKGRTAEQNMTDTVALMRGLGDKSQRVLDTYGKYRAFNDAELAHLVDSGFITKEASDNFKRTHPHYSHNDVIDFADNPGNYSRSTSPASISSTGIHAAEGSVREIERPDVAFLRQMQEQRVRVAKNVATRDLTEATYRAGLGEAKGYRPLRTAADVTASNEAKKMIGEVAAKAAALRAGKKTLSGAMRKQTAKLEKVSNEIASLLGNAQDLAGAAESNPIFDRKIANILKRLDPKDEKKAALGGVLAKLQEGKGAIDENLGALASIRKDLQQAIREHAGTEIKEVDLSKAGLGTISYIKDGIKEIHTVPKAEADVMKGVDESAWASLGQWLEKGWMQRTFLKGPATLTRALATQYNPVFVANNWVKDIGGAYVNAGLSPIEAVATAGKLLASAIFPKSAVAKNMAAIDAMILNKGGLQRGHFNLDRGVTREMLADAVDPRNPFFKAVTNVRDLVPTAGQFFEEATRKAVFISELRKTGSVDAAIAAMKSATADFSQAGSSARTLNKVVPFLNASIQGTVSLATALKDKPFDVARRLLVSGAYPTALLYSNNSQYKSYQDIPSWEKDKYWIYMLGEEDGKDIYGQPKKIPNYIKLPKGIPQQIVGSVVEFALNKGKGEYPQTTNEFLGSLAGAISPVSESSFIPSFVQYPLELKTNYSFFRGKAIEPDWVLAKDGQWYKSTDVPPEMRTSYDTSTIAKIMGEALGYSPAKIDYIIKTGAMNDAIRVIEPLFIKEPTAVEEQPQTPFEKASQAPFLRSYAGSSSYGQDIRAKEAESLTTQQENAAKIADMFELKAKAYIEGTMSPVERMQFSEQIKDPSLKKKFTQYRKDKQLGIDKGDEHIRSMGVADGERAKQILKNMAAMDTVAASEYLSGLRRKKIATPDVLRQIRKAQTE
jgi:hypothetical protein